MREVIKQVLTTEQIDQGRKMQAVAFKEYYKMRCILPTISGMERGAKPCYLLQENSKVFCVI